MNSERSLATEVFKNYWTQVRKGLSLVGGDRQGFIKKEVIDLQKRDWLQIDGKEFVQCLFDSMASKGWKETPGSNWIWREVHIKPSDENDSQEVLLEHEIIKLGGERWTRQISTASGVDTRQDGKRTRGNRRRAIDLVYDQGNGGFSFVELKVSSDSPIYALFEILGYGLAYWHSRQEKPTHGIKASRLMVAEKIDLVVLGPDCWYRENASGVVTEHQFALDRLVKQLNIGLAELTQGEPLIQIYCASFSHDRTLNEVISAGRAIEAVISLAGQCNRGTL